MLDKLKELTKDTAIYGISTMIGRFLNFILVPFYTNVFIPSDYGIALVLYAYIAILNIFYIYGIDAAYMRFAGMSEKGNEQENFSTPFLTVLFTAFLFSCVIALSSGRISEQLAIPQNLGYVVYLIALMLFFDATAVIPFIKLRLERKAKKFALFKVLNIMLNIALNLILILHFKLGIEAVFISNLAASIFSVILLLPSILKALQFKINIDLLRRLLKFGLPYLPGGFAVMLVQVVDVQILDQLTDRKTVGLYKSVYKLGIFMMLFVNMFQYAWQPFFLQNAREANAKEIFSKVLTYFMVAGSVILITLSLFINDLVKIQFGGFSIIGSMYWEGLYIVPVILFAYLFNGMYVIFTAGIYIEEKSIYVPIISGAGAAVNIITNYLLIPVWGIMGAAAATLASYFVMAAGYFIVTQKFYHIEYEFGKIIKIFAAILLVGVSYYVLDFNEALNIVYKLILLAVFLSIILLFVFDKKESAWLKKKTFG